MKHDDAIAIMHAAGFPDAEAYFRKDIPPGWFVRAEHVSRNPNVTRSGRGKTLRAALVDAGFEAPPSPDFATHGVEVVRGGEAVARAVSKSMAERIANALNQYEPDARGR